LRAEVFRLRADNRSLGEQFRHEQERFEEILALYHQVVGREANRLDAFVDGLRPKPVEARESGERNRPVRTIREPWAKVAARQEAKHTLEYWENKQATLEKEVADLEANIDARRTGSKSGSGSGTESN
jgi:hypothetical protein